MDIRREKREVFITTAGQVFLSETECYRQEAIDRLQAWAEREGVCSGGNWSSAMVIDTMLECAEELSTALQFAIGAKE